MKRLYSKFLFVLLALFSLAFNAGCNVYVSDEGNITIDLDKENLEGEATNDEKDESEEIQDTDNDDSSTVKPEELPENGTTLFASNSYITNKATIIETEHFKFEIDENVFVPGYLEEYIEIIYDTLETVSGLSFHNEVYNPGKIVIEVAKPYNEKFPESELGGAYAYSKGATIHICAGDLLLGNTYTITHELSHILQYSQSSWHYSQVYVEGFAEYTSHKAAKYLEDNNIVAAYLVGPSYSHINNMEIHGDLYSQTIEYWIENPKEASSISFNSAYAVGFRLMSYLDDVYGNYSNWIKYYETVNPYHKNKYVDQEVTLTNQLKAMKVTYGDNVLNNFYSWVKVNESKFARQDSSIYDLSALEEVIIYPEFNAVGDTTTLSDYVFKYNNLLINIEEARNYLKYYKNRDVSNLKLKLQTSKQVALYNENKELILNEVDDEFLLDGVSYIKLVGEGTLGAMYKKGFMLVYDE